MASRTRRQSRSAALAAAEFAPARDSATAACGPSSADDNEIASVQSNHRHSPSEKLSFDAGMSASPSAASKRISAEPERGVRRGARARLPVKVPTKKPRILPGWPPLVRGGWQRAGQWQVSRKLELMEV